MPFLYIMKTRIWILNVILSPQIRYNWDREFHQVSTFFRLCINIIIMVTIIITVIPKRFFLRYVKLKIKKITEKQFVYSIQEKYNFNDVHFNYYWLSIHIDVFIHNNISFKYWYFYLYFKSNCLILLKYSYFFNNV